MAPRPVKVTITYCSECGYEPQTLALTEALMKAFRHELTEIELIPWDEGSFDVTVDGELIHSMYREGGFAEHAAVIAAVRRRQALPAPASALAVPAEGV
ncbi:MAG TPA: Rdx family protein [Ktedonobacterales bacterium]|nr:Rdx family protein [Ktedonobacterales bacterium]